MSPNSGSVGQWSRRRFLQGIGASIVGGANLLSHPFPARALAINPRASWAIDRPAKGPLPSEDVRFLLVHHSASRSGHTAAEVPAILRSFYDFHTSPEKGWNDIAYNFLIDTAGGIWEGRSGSLAGAVAGDATGGNQGYSQLVCLIGDFNETDPSPVSLTSLTALLAWLADKHGVATSPGSQVSFTSRGSNLWPSGATVTTPTITGHRTMSKTSCPGDALYNIVTTSLPGDVHAVRGGAPPAQPTSTTSVVTIATSTSTTSELVPTSEPSATTTEADPIPTAAPATTEVRATVVTSSPTTPDVVVATANVEAADGVAGSAGSSAPLNPLIWAAAGLGAAATAGLAWRYRRMGD